MKAKIASKIINNHLNGNATENSKKILSAIAEKVVAAGLKPPFQIKKVAIFNPDEPEFEETPEFRQHEERTRMIPETNEFKKDVKDKVRVPKDLARGLSKILNKDKDSGRDRDLPKDDINF